MFARTPERKMQLVRSVLLGLWLLLIVSLLWDPLTPLLTAADNLASPFHLGTATAVVQGVRLPVAPYAMGNRIFWTMVLPILPLAMMFFGHETWRRVCPLSHLSQLPGRLGWRRRLRRLNRSTGRVDRLLALIPGQSWLAANHQYVQFGFLALGVLGRLLFYNSDRIALAIAFTSVLSLALLVGLLYGGKTWCNYFCPAAVIQSVYTGAGGLFDSKAHITQMAVSQSMCRTPGPQGDQSACVGCTANCSDVDVENAYWKSAESDKTQFVYYGFFGLVFAFYTYYYVYSGGWSYYMSGGWTHEQAQLASLLAPGIYLFGTAIPVPKIIAAPLYFAVCIALSYGLFAAAERQYARFATWRGAALSKLRLRHRMLSLCAFLTINLFYVFAGRPNILLMPGWATPVIDAVILLVSTAWLARSLARDPDMYGHERLARTLRAQLVRLGFRSEELLDGVSIDRLSADEVYVLAKTLPNFTALQKREAYRAILTEALETGHTQSAESLRLLSDLRGQLGLSDADHHAVLDALDIQDPTLLDPQVARSAEMHASHATYRKFLLDHAEATAPGGTVPAGWLASSNTLAALQPARAQFNLSEDDHARIAESVADEERRLVDSAERALDGLGKLEAARFSLRLDPQPEALLLRRALSQKQVVLTREVAGTIAAIDDESIARSLAQSIYAVVGPQGGVAMTELVEWVPDEVRHAFAQMTPDPVLWSYLDVVEASKPVAAVFAKMAGNRDPIVAALAIAASAGLDRARAAKDAAALLAGLKTPSPLIEDVLARVRRGVRSDIVTMMAQLAGAAVFAALDLEALGQVARRSALVSFAAGDHICRTGDAPDWMFVLSRGATRAWIDGDGDDDRRVIGEQREGAVFGEFAVLTKRPHPASVEVTSATATVVAIPRAVIDELFSRNPQMARDVLAVVSGYLLDRLAAPPAGRGDFAPVPDAVSA